RWEMFDLERGVWTKPHSLTKQARTHRLPLNAAAVAVLQELRAETAVTEPKLFPDLTGPDLHRVWTGVCRQAGITGCRLHDLRHTFASILVSSGLSLPVIGNLLGHSQPSTTARYAHLFDDVLRGATERVGNAVAG